MKILTNVALMVITLVMLSTFQANAAGLGQSMIVNGDLHVAVVQNPHKNFVGEWGYLDPNSGNPIFVGVTSDIGVFQFIGSFDGEEIIFWADGKNKRFYTGHGSNSIEPGRFVINGVKFDVVVDQSGGWQEEIVEPVQFVEAYSEIETFDESDCSQNDITYQPVKFTKLQSFRKDSINLDACRMIVTGNTIDWHLFKDGAVTVEVTFNDSCDDTFNVTDTINYFIRPDKNYEGYRLTDYDYPESGIYPSKIRVTKENGNGMHYIYINKVDVSHLVGQLVSVKFRLYQDGELVQAYQSSATMTELVK